MGKYADIAERQHGSERLMTGATLPLFPLVELATKKGGLRLILVDQELISNSKDF